MEKIFNEALGHILVYEGGYVDHPLDPGGATNFGITQNTLSRFRKKRVSKRDVRTITNKEVEEIYHKMYWKACSCHKLPEAIAFAVFDCGVNQGVSRAIQFLQKAVGTKVDGIIGPITLSAVKRSNRLELLNEFMARRMKHYGGLSKLFKTFGLGWSRRLIATHSLALKKLNS